MSTRNIMAIVLFCAAFAISCTDRPTPFDPLQSDVAHLSPAACEARGGSMMPVGRLQTSQCVVSYADAGKACSDGAECQGDCLSEVRDDVATNGQAYGMCAADSNRFGCRTVIKAGVARPTLCID